MSLIDFSWAACHAFYNCTVLPKYRVYLPILSCADSFSYLYNLQSCSDSIISLCCGLNFLFQALNSPVALLHASFSALMRVCISCSPSMYPVPYDGHLPFSLRSYASAQSTFTTSVSSLKVPHTCQMPSS